MTIFMVGVWKKAIIPAGDGGGLTANPPSLELELPPVPIPVSDKNSSRSMNSKLKSLFSGLFQRLGPKNAEEESNLPVVAFPFAVPSANFMTLNYPLDQLWICITLHVGY